MEMTLEGLAKHLKNVITPEIPKIYGIHERFQNISDEESIGEGVLAFRNFLYELCDMLIAEGNLYHIPKKNPHEFEDRLTISVYFPFLHNIKSLLLNMGYYGELIEGNRTLVVGLNIFNKKLAPSKSLACLKFLTKCGLLFDGIDLHNKKQDLSKIENIIVTYPNNPAMLLGWKAMAVGELEVGLLVKEPKKNKNSVINYSRYSDILMRCDYRVLLSPQSYDATSIIRDTIKPLSLPVQDFVVDLHQYYLDKGMKCNVDIKDLWIKAKYSYKSKEIWGINVSLNNGYQITIKAKNTHKYKETIKEFPILVQEMIERGFGCGIKRGISDHCNGGCQGFRFGLDKSVIDIRNVIKTWINTELLYV